MLMQYWFPFRGCSPFWLYSWLGNWNSCLLWGFECYFERKIRRKRNFSFCLFVFDWYGWALIKEKKTLFFFELALQGRTFLLKKKFLLAKKNESLFPEPKKKKKKAFPNSFIRTKPNKKQKKSLFSFIFLLKHSIWSQ